MNGDHLLESIDFIGAEHLVDQFDSGAEEVNIWLQSHAVQSDRSGGSRTYVVCQDGSRVVVAYYAISVGEIEGGPRRLGAGLAGGRDIGVALLTWLGVDREYQGTGMGASLLVDACWRILWVSRFIGLRGLVVDALNEGVAEWYQSFGFRRFEAVPLRLYALAKDIRQSVGEDYPARVRELAFPV